ncbi:hypothetical protein [Pseudemcibacter aquimaris]|uniref:hypothetical protein n=1 Tax=Pseudemcibacter aquimaris TaxID=2857064 RepID=UPI002013A26F|nr:hypothetical protein [Pseudemcibacter aquimaris]MCC3860032.1 hypothetical protein [Pseudemcibacter aquimaris]WDU57362.1 hypothetical protein KW060_09140 [Pseudemcibacter aquimaris]
MLPEMKIYIDNLKAKDDFRPEGMIGYKRLPFWIFILSLFISALLLALLIKMGLLEKSIKDFSVLLVIIFLFGLFIKAMVLFPSKLLNFGKIAVGKITYAQYSPFPFVVGSGWRINAEFYVNEKKYEGIQWIKSFKNTEYKGFNLPKEGDEIIIFYEENNPEKNAIFVPGYFYKNCLSKSRYNDVSNLFNSMS